MKISGHGLREHLRLLIPSLGLITAVFVLRLVLHAAGAPSGLVRACSVTVAGAVAVLVAVLFIHTRRFGSYPNVVVATLFLVGWEQLLLSGAIAFYAFTGVSNVYSVPEYSSGRFADPWHHIAGHLIFGLGFGELLGAAMGCLLLWMLRRLVPVEQAR
jgi:hypothetical protein